MQSWPERKICNYLGDSWILWGSYGNGTIEPLVMEASSSEGVLAYQEMNASGRYYVSAQGQRKTDTLLGIDLAFQGSRGSLHQEDFYPPDYSRRSLTNYCFSIDDLEFDDGVFWRKHLLDSAIVDVASFDLSVALIDGLVYVRARHWKHYQHCTTSLPKLLH